jgi:hypothetical protein
MAATTTPQQNTGINITVQNESENYRNIRRNSSKQIVSYTLPEDSDKEYGYKRIPGTTTVFESQVYNRTIPQLSNELITPLPDFTNEVIRQNFVKESKMYYQVGSTLQPIRGDELVEPKDEFSGRYELSPAAPSFRGNAGGTLPAGKKEGGQEIKGNDNRYGPNTHFGGISWSNEDTVNATDGYITFPGHKEIAWDNTVYGPPLQQYGYRVTKELIESGRNLNIRAVVGFQVKAGSSNVGAYAAIMRRRDTSKGRIVTKGQTHLGSDAPHYPLHQLVYDIPNNQLVENALYQITTNFGTRDDGTFIMGDKCLFEVTAQLPEEPTISWPTPPNETNTNQNIVSDEATETSTRSNG